MISRGGVARGRGMVVKKTLIVYSEVKKSRAKKTRPPEKIKESGL